MIRTLTGLVALALLISMVVESWAGVVGKKPQRVKEPSWYQSPPKDKKNVLVRGRAEAPDMQLAIDKAVLAARTELASVFESSWQEFLGSLHKEMSSCGVPALKAGEMTLVGTKIRHQKVTKTGKGYTAFVLLSWPRASFGGALFTRAQEDPAWFDRVKGAKAVAILRANK